MIRDYGKYDFREVGKLSSFLPSYVRHCCRSRYDGTDTQVLDSFRYVSIRVLQEYKETYPFVNNHLTILKYYSPDMVLELMENFDEKPAVLGCMATAHTIGLPKRACLHCPKVGQWIRRMHLTGTVNKETGERYDFK